MVSVSVSLQAALSPEERRTCPDLQDFFSRKRKRRDGEESQGNKEPKLVKDEEEEEDTELDLDAPLPSEWQRCLDLKVDRYQTLQAMSAQMRLHGDPEES